MPVIIPKGLPAEEVLKSERIFTMNEQRAHTQDIRPLKVGILNLMPTKEATEIQLLRRLSNTPLQIEVDLIHTESYKSNNTDSVHLERFYKTFSQIKNNKYDAFIITGAPVENLEYDEVVYWNELKNIFDYIEDNVFSTMFICWAAQAAFYHYYGVDKYNSNEKIFGIYKYTPMGNSPLVRGFDDVFDMPQSRHTYNLSSELMEIEDLEILADNPHTGVNIAATKDNRLIFVTGHWEYDHDTLHKEYVRDLDKGLDIKMPINYYVDDDMDKGIEANWRAHGNLFFSNWLNYYVYQETPYDILSIRRRD
ncbi:homoserine O-succinyltransferase [Microaceticoccus formicicus]|uniref:homoserine O-succinyltransferase n=1 Tax=Microaceticoccus formicicus TaxID=3118105 RepID=UPI003CD00851|nr:homoserine O-succinyltransferase [Peptoniphilaceae bacterium AMB_02]